jgi:bacterioferritin-associated ferredoxin
VISCVCVNVNEEKIRELIREGHDTIEKLQDFGICLGCRMCYPYIMDYIKEEKGDEESEDSR